MNQNIRCNLLIIIALLFALNGIAQIPEKGGKVVIYQLLPRLFGNKNTSNKSFGTLEQNGTGKFNDINEKALAELKDLGITHIWYTGVIAHASLTDYSKYGIKRDDADVVKGIAGSPYAIRDYYDVDPDLAVDVNKRMQEFKTLLERTHRKGLKVLIDFVPNHVARGYHSYAKPNGTVDFGEQDDKTKAFSPANDFYYIPGKSLVVPGNKNGMTKNAYTSLKDGRFDEYPAKATGNNVFTESPSIDDWYETIKLNYGVDIQNGNKTYFDPVPPVWEKMRDILVYWANKKVDGFRCDVAEMVPVEFWAWVIPQVKQVNPQIMFLAEAYDASKYKAFIEKGKFDYLYDKVGIYDSLKKLIKNEESGNTAEISTLVNHFNATGLNNHMLRFLENHDEERIASAGFAGNADYAIPAMVLSATLSGSPLMIYFGQEVGEPGKGVEGFGGEDNRTTIFDYWGVPEHQKWMNEGKFDGGKLTNDKKQLRSFYKKLLHLVQNQEALREGRYQEIPLQAEIDKKVFAYVRYTQNQRLLIVVNFDRKHSLNTHIKIPGGISGRNQQMAAKDLLSGRPVMENERGIQVNILPVTAQIIEF